MTASCDDMQRKVQLNCNGCGFACGVLTAATGTLSDGSGSLSYSNNSNCEWMIAPYGAVQITIEFTSFSTQPINDVVRVFQCSDVYCSQQQQLAELSGTYPVIQAAAAKTGYMKVVFASDSSSTYDGFTASWRSVSTQTQHLSCVCAFKHSAFCVQRYFEQMLETG